MGQWTIETQAYNGIKAQWEEERNKESIDLVDRTRPLSKYKEPLLLSSHIYLESIKWESRRTKMRTPLPKPLYSEGYEHYAYDNDHDGNSNSTSANYGSHDSGSDSQTDSSTHSEPGSETDSGSESSSSDEDYSLLDYLGRLEQRSQEPSCKGSHRNTHALQFPSIEETEEEEDEEHRDFFANRSEDNILALAQGLLTSKGGKWWDTCKS